MQKAKSVRFLSFLHSFRAFAIINIVAGHAVSAMYLSIYQRYNWSDPILNINEIFFNHCTLYFALISGLLFTSVLSGKSYTKFYSSRFLHVFLPYLFFTVFYSIVKIERYNIVYVNIDRGSQNLINNLLVGGSNFVLWYMPVLFGLFILTPFFHFLFKHKKYTSVFIWIIMLIPLISTGIKIPFIYGMIISKIIYFSGAYVLGMYLGTNIDAGLNWLKEHLLQIVLVALASTAVLFYLHFNAINKVGGVYLQDSFYYIQKICLAGMLLIFFKGLGEQQPLWLIRVAAYSTPIYFIHGAIVFSCASLFLFIGADKQYADVYIVSGAVLLTLFTICISMLVAFLIKKVFGKRSRMIIGG